jgi:hypothetical protein
MKITKDMMNRKHISSGSYLALASMNQYDDTNTYMSPWWVVDSKYLKKNVKWFQGWERIDALPLKFNKSKAPIRHYLEIDGKPKYNKQSNFTAVNVLLVLYKEKGDWNNCHPYAISNSCYYNAHRDRFNGWVDLEDIAIDLNYEKNN